MKGATEGVNIKELSKMKTIKKEKIDVNLLYIKTSKNVLKFTRRVITHNRNSETQNSKLTLSYLLGTFVISSRINYEIFFPKITKFECCMIFFVFVFINFFVLVLS